MLLKFTKCINIHKYIKKSLNKGRSWYKTVKGFLVHSNLLNFTTPFRRPMVFFLLSEGINGARLWAFYENSIRPVEVKPSSLSSTITMKFLMSTQPRDPQNSECHPEGEDSGCASPAPSHLLPSSPALVRRSWRCSQASAEPMTPADCGEEQFPGQ